MGQGLQLYDGNMEWMWTCICRAMCRRRVRGYEGLEVEEKAHVGRSALCFR